MVNTDSNIQLQSGWATHVNSDGSQIAPAGTPDPSSFGMIQELLDKPQGTLFWMGTPQVTNPPFACCEYYIKRPVQANTGRLILSFDLTPDSNFVSNAWIKEVDTKLCLAGKMFNFSLQRIMKTNMIQVSNKSGLWVDTGFIAPPFIASETLHHRFIYGFDIVQNLYGIQNITIGGVEFEVPFTLADLPDLSTTWPDGAYLQNQDQVGPSGGIQRYILENLQYAWS